MNDEEKKELLSKYIDRSKKFNIFKVLKTDNYEIRHSNFLAWLFNPNETHGLRTQFIKKFFEKVKKYNITNNITNPKESISENLKFNNKNIEVKREVKIPNGQYIDILITSDNFVCVIENKYGSFEHDQCQAYRTFALEMKKKYCICIYLDLDDIEFSKNENNKFEGYHLATYKDTILPILRNIQKEGLISQLDILNQYITVLEEQYAIFNDKELPNINDKIKDLRKNLCMGKEVNDNSQIKPFALQIIPVEKDQYPTVKNDSKCCMLYYWITFENNGLFFNIILREPEDKYKSKVDKICELLNINNNITTNETIVKREEIIPYYDYIDLLYETNENIKKNKINEKINLFLNDFAGTNKQIINILISDQK